MDDLNKTGSFEKQRVQFLSEGECVVGELHLPEGRDRCAAAVLLGPLTSVKEQATGSYAQALARRGIAALSFDPRYFGESGGQPRQYENPNVTSAVSFLAAHPRVDGTRPKTIHWLDSKGQIDFYDDPALIEPAVDRLVEGMRAQLG